ncbi:hypothetical protein [Bifidobacterium pseudocatenulatum]|jgi:serine O-acetyltransferase|uniref:hypothetical protein n=1 Tax=Bifidobacterium pseudocatenulatum TaxID=28026 RepID=UPI000FEFA4BE|nr:hypothetical protein [Bifidobacterium pseudocatenulatum]RHH03416.1 hypothetical protein DW231_05905 [Bifidobacterium pseudocatenulatum]
MIVTKSDLREYIQEDQRMQPWPSNPLKRIIGAGGAMVRWKVYLRKCDYHHNVSQNLYHKLAYVWYLFFLKKYERRFCSEIPINVFGKGLLIWHPGRIIVNPESTVGDYCSLSSGVVIAQAHGRCPVVGHHVEFMIDSKVLGGCRVADYVRIGANALVLKPIEEENTTWAGVPARKINDRGAIETPAI